MIEVIIDHYYADDYFIISEINVFINDEDEKLRIEREVNKNRLVESIGYPNRPEVAGLLQVDPSLIDKDMYEIDLI